MRQEAGGEQVVQAANTAWNQHRAREERGVSLTGRQGAGGDQQSSARPTVHFTTWETQTPGDARRGTSVHTVLSTTSGLPRAPEGHLGPQNLLEPSTVAPPRRARTPHHPPESDPTPALALFSAHDTSVSQSPVGSRPF